MRLSDANIKDEYPSIGECKRTVKAVGEPLLQSDYGAPNDCTLTSLAYIFGEKMYWYIEKVAASYGYDGNGNGTNPLRVKSIMQEIIAHLKLHAKPKSAYLKRVGVTWKKCVGLCESGTSFLLNLHNDGRGWYQSHTVTVIGYSEYENGKFLIVYDNWYKGESLIDFDKLSAICSINWIEYTLRSN